MGETFDPVVGAPGGGDYPCSCGVPVGDCPFWRAVAGEMRRRGLAFSGENWNTDFDLVISGRFARRFKAPARDAARLARLLLLKLGPAAYVGATRAKDALVDAIPSLRERMRVTAQRNISLFESVLHVSGKSVFVDTSKGYRRVVLLTRSTGLEPRVIHLVRDAPGYVNSCRKNLGQSTARACDEWLVLSQRAMLLRKRLPRGQWLRVRYEDLCADPLGTLAEICRFLGVEVPTRLPDLNASDHHIRGNRMRLQPIGAIRADSSWELELPRREVDYILRRTLAARRSLGYAA